MNQEKIGKFIQENRKNKKLTQEELAQKLNVNSKTVSRWENGICLPDLSLIKVLCKELDISITEFLSGEYIDEENYKGKLEENIIEVTNYTNKRKKKSKVTLLIRSIMILLLVIFIILLVNTLDGHGFSLLNIDEYLLTRKINKKIMEEDIKYFIDNMDYDLMYQSYFEYNSVVENTTDGKIIYDYNNLDSFDEYKNNIDKQLEETLKKVKINRFESIDGYGNLYFNDTQVIDVQYGINPNDIIHYKFNNERIEIRFSYFIIDENNETGYNYLPVIIIKDKKA